MNGLEFGRARLEPIPPNTGSFEVVIEHRLLGFFALHDDFGLELGGKARIQPDVTPSP